MNFISCHSEVMNSINGNKPLVSILINNYNYAIYLKQAIDSALSQTYKNIEVIVVDDGSTDNSREVVNSYGNQIITVFKTNGGQASALNAGFAVSKGEIICLLDADDIFLPGKVSEVVDLFKLYPSGSWVFHESVPVQSADIVNKEFEMIFENISNRFPEKLPEEIDFRRNLLNAELPNFTPSTSNLCFSRTLLEKIFPLPEVKGISGMAITDAYIKYLAVGLTTGCVANKDLGIFRIHNNNTYSNQIVSKKRKVYAEVYLMTAYWMQINFPKFSKLSKKLFSKGWANYLRVKNNDLKYDEEIKDYLSSVTYTEKFEITLKTFYYFIKLSFVSLV